MVTIGEDGVPEFGGKEPAVRTNAGILIRGDTGALEELIKAMDETAEALDVQVVFVKRSKEWLTIADGKPEDVLGDRV